MNHFAQFLYVNCEISNIMRQIHYTWVISHRVNYNFVRILVGYFIYIIFFLRANILSKGVSFVLDEA